MSNTMNISSANATAILTVEELFPSGLVLEMFGTDQGLSQESIEITETRMGVDGKMVAGYTPGIYPVTLTLEAASPSFASLGILWTAMMSNKTIYPCTLVATLPSINRVFIWSVGVMKSGVPFPSMKKTLEATSWVFHFQDFEQGAN